jgi:hypothetical protein
VCVCVGGKGGAVGGGPRSKCVPTKSKCVHTKPKSECVPTSVAQSRQTGSVQNSKGVGGVFVFWGEGGQGWGPEVPSVFLQNQNVFLQNHNVFLPMKHNL